MGPRDSEQTGQHQPGIRSAQDEIDPASREAGSPNASARLALSVIGIYQKFSRHTPPSCRFTPSCSEYTRQAIVRYGFCKGAAMGAWRICRCHPFSKGGADPLR